MVERKTEELVKMVDLPRSVTENYAREEMDLAIAREVLQQIVDMHESSITVDTPLDSLVGHTIEQIRQAERVVAQSIVSENGADKLIMGGLHTQKETPQGRAHLFLQTDKISLSLVKEGKYVLENKFPLVEPEDNISRIFTGFSDFRSGRSNVTSLYGLAENPTLAGFQQMVRGVRWMNANMLDWGKPTIIMPEQLDKRGIASQ